MYTAATNYDNPWAIIVDPSRAGFNTLPQNGVLSEMLNINTMTNMYFTPMTMMNLEMNDQISDFVSTGQEIQKFNLTGFNNRTVKPLEKLLEDQKKKLEQNKLIATQNKDLAQRLTLKNEGLLEFEARNFNNYLPQTAQNKMLKGWNGNKYLPRINQEKFLMNPTGTDDTEIPEPIDDTEMNNNNNEDPAVGTGLGEEEQFNSDDYETDEYGNIIFEDINGIKTPVKKQGTDFDMSDKADLLINNPDLQEEIVNTIIEAMQEMADNNSIAELQQKAAQQQTDYAALAVLKGQPDVFYENNPEVKQQVNEIIVQFAEENNIAISPENATAPELGIPMTATVQKNKQQIINIIPGKTPQPQKTPYKNPTINEEKFDENTPVKPNNLFNSPINNTQTPINNNTQTPINNNINQTPFNNKTPGNMIPPTPKLTQAQLTQLRKEIVESLYDDKAKKLFQQIGDKMIKHVTLVRNTNPTFGIVINDPTQSKFDTRYINDYGKYGVDNFIQMEMYALLNNGVYIKFRKMAKMEITTASAPLTRTTAIRKVAQFALTEPINVWESFQIVTKNEGNNKYYKYTAENNNQKFIYDFIVYNALNSDVLIQNFILWDYRGKSTSFFQSDNTIQKLREDLNS